MKIFSSSDLNFSEEAIAHFASSLENRGKGEGIKIGVRKAGCSGYEYYFDYVDSFDSNGVIFDKKMKALYEAPHYKNETRKIGLYMHTFF